MAELRGVLVLVAIFSWCSLIPAKEFVPVLVWETPERNAESSLPSVSATEHLTQKQFNGDIASKLNHPGPLLIFLQDSLSLEDFVQYGNVYGTHGKKNAFANVQNLLEANPSTMFPAVESPQNSIPVLAKDRKRIDVTGDSYSVQDAMNSVLVFHLPSTTSAANRQQALARNDAMIGDIINKTANEHHTYLAIYTAQRSSWVEDEDENVRIARHTLAETSGVSSESYPGRLFFVSGSVLFYSENITFNDNLLPVDQLTLDSVNENNDTVRATLSLKSVPGGNLTSLAVVMTLMKLPTNNWQLQNFTIQYSLQSQGERFGIASTNGVWAPMSFSFHCGSQTFTSKESDNTKTTLTFQNFQLQPFIGTTATFGDPWDCVGFFTIGIWMAIFVCVILFLILGFGIYMVMSINTMDRFDDPKGKTITVNATE